MALPIIYMINTNVDHDLNPDGIDFEIVSVLLPLAVDITFTYKFPTDAINHINSTTSTLYSIVKVPFRNTEKIGIIIDIIHDKKDCHEIEQHEELEFLKKHKLKSICHAFNNIPRLNEKLIQFMKQVACYNIIPLGSVLKMVLSSIKAIEKFPYIEELGAAKEAMAKQPETIIESDIVLTQQQQRIFDLIASQNLSKYSANLLEGVTGSGKTELYLKILERAIRKGGQALVLLPEIVLTAQLINRFRRHFPDTEVYQWHSTLTQKQRIKTWQEITLGKARIIVGARSALFLPYYDLKIIIIDEEHDTSFKQEEIAIYNGRDMAILRAKIENIPIILSSATPSIETINNVHSKRYNHYKLTERFSKVLLPEVQIVDLNFDKLAKDSWISTALKNSILETLDSKKQSLLFLNRRGYAPLTICKSCGNKKGCPNCSCFLVMHKKKMILQCHYCGYHTSMSNPCIQCGEDANTVAYGPGVERISEEVKALFPEARIAILTSDTISEPKAASEAIRSIIEHEVDIIIGTQIIAKGLHFHKLHLVGVIDVDFSLSFGDFRLLERTYQVLEQVAGRAGREDIKGLVMIQSYEPKNEILQKLKNYQKDLFIEAEINNRMVSNTPPFSRMVLITASSYDEKESISIVKKLVETAPTLAGVDVLGPSPAPLLMLRKKFRYRVLIRAKKNINIQKFIN